MHAFSSDSGSIRFGEFELEPKSGELRKAGLPVKLQPQPLRVLVLLASNPGELITREEIQQGLNKKNELHVVTSGRRSTIFLNGKQVSSLRGFPPTGKSKSAITTA